MKYPRDHPKASDFLFYGFMALIYGFVATALIWAIISILTTLF